jgi:hypothetical protein
MICEVVSVFLDNLSNIRPVEVKTAFPNVESIQIVSVPKHCTKNQENENLVMSSVECRTYLIPLADNIGKRTVFAQGKSYF